MLSLTEIYESYQDHAGSVAFPSSPENLYGSIVYFLDYPGKRIRPVLCLMGNELFDKIHPNAYVAAYAMELFHNFTLVHDDIMDHSAIRRGRPTLHVKYGQDTAILAGDMLLIHAYLQLNKITQEYRTQIINIFSEMACQVCEGQQMDIEFEDRAIESVSYEEYLKMITLKTSVLLGAAAKIGAIIGLASDKQQEDIYEFGKNIGIAFQIQDDFLDAFGNTLKMGKRVGSDILENKKTALLLKAFELANSSQKNQLKEAMNTEGESRVQTVIAIYKELKVDLWAGWAIHHYTEIAFSSLDRIEIPIYKKEKLTELANSLLVRQS